MSLQAELIFSCLSIKHMLFISGKSRSSQGFIVLHSITNGYLIPSGTTLLSSISCATRLLNIVVVFNGWIAKFAVQINSHTHMPSQADKIIADNDFVSIWLEESGNPAIEELTQLNFELARKTTTDLAEKGITEHDLALILDINPEEIKRWLIGKHPFSIKTLKQISTALADYKV